MRPSRSRTRALALLAALAAALTSVTLPSPANAASTAIRITEFKTGGSGGEFIEFTNVSGSSQSMSGWSYADSSAKAGDVSLSSFGTLAAGESAILTDGTDAGFRSTWNLCAGVKIIAGNTKDNLSSNSGGDQIHVYDNTNAQVDSVTYTSPSDTVTYRLKAGTSPNGTFSGNYTTSTVGDIDGSLASTAGEAGSPGKSAYGSGQTVCTASAITPAYAGLPAAIGDSTNPTMAVTLGSSLSGTTMTGSAASSSIASAVTVTGTGTSRTVTVTPGTTEGVTTITLTAGSSTATFQYGLTRNQNNSSQRWYSGVGNLSTAVDAGGGYFWAGDDESNVLHLYNADSSSEPVASFDIAAAFGTTFAEEIDIEAAARVGNTIYWTGSMSNKNDGTNSTPRSTVFATTISGTGASSTLTKTGSLYTNLRADLKSFDSSNTYGLNTGFSTGTNGHDPSMANLEGMEFAPGSSTTMYLAFRGPIKNNKALIVPVTNFPSLVSGTSPTFGTPFFLNVGSGYGIREIRKNASDQYLIVSGLTVSDGSGGFNNAGFKLFTWDGVPADAPVDTAISIPQMPVGMAADTVGAYEAIVTMPASTSGGTVRLAQDDGDATPYGTSYGSAKSGTLSGVNALQKDLSLTFTLPSTLAVGAISDQTATVGTPISGFSASASGGASPYTYAATGLPAGISLSSAGAFSGTPTADGTFTVNVTATDSTSATASTSFTWTVAKGAQAITFTSAAPSAAVVGGATYAVSATGGGSGNAVTFSSGTTGVCTVSGSTVTSVGAGTCTVRADQAAGNGYSAAPQVTQSFTVGKGAQTITFTSLAPTNEVAGGATYAVTATGGASGNPVTFSSGTAGVCTVAGSTVTFQHAGTCTVQADQAGSASYNAAPQATQTITVGKAAQVITFTSTAPSAAVVGGTTYAVTATGGGSGNTVTFSSGTTGVCTVSGSTVSFVGAGTCTVRADQAGSADYTAATQVIQSFAVGKAAQAITFTSTAPETAVVGGSAYTVTATGGASGNAVTFSSGTPAVCTVAGSTVSFVGAGSCTVNADQAGSADYLAAPQVGQTFAVGKAAQAITFTSTAPDDAAVGGATYAVSATGGGSGNDVTFSSETTDVCTVAGSTVTFVGAGTCTLDADQAGNADYKAAPQAAQSFDVAPGSQTILFTSTAPETAVVGGPTYHVTAVGGASGNDVTFSTGTIGVCTITGSTVTFVGAGTCRVDADQAGDADYTAAPRASQDIAVGAGSQAITFTSTAPDDAAVGGTYAVSATGGGSGNDVTFSSGTTDVCTVTGATVHFVAAGTCTVLADQAGDADHSAAPQASQDVEVGQGDQAITFTSTAPTNAVVGGPTYAVSATGGDSGNDVTFTSGSTGVCTVSGGTVTFVGAGTCVIRADQAGDADYHAAPQAQQSVTVGKAAQTITFTSDVPTDAVVGGTAYQVTAIGGGSGNDVVFTSATPDVCAVSGSSVTFVGVGTCAIDANQAGNADYLAAPQVAQSFGVDDGGSTAPTYAYVNENPHAGSNQVSAYRIGANGASTLIATYDTGHPGSGGWYAGAKAAVAHTGKFLFVLNLGDQTITTFAIDPDTGALSLRTTTAPIDRLSNGSLAVNPTGTVLYTGALAGTQDQGHLNSFTISANGTVSSTPTATVNVEADGLSLSPDGSQIAVAGPRIGVRIFGTGSDGHLTAGPTSDVPGATDVRWLDPATLVVGSTAPGGVGFYSLTVSALNLLGSVSVPAGRQWSQTLAVGPDGTAFIGTSDGLRSAKVVSGELVLGPLAAAAPGLDASDWISSIAVTPDGDYLLVGADQDDSVYQYRIGADSGSGPALTYQRKMDVGAGLPTITTYAP